MDVRVITLRYRPDLHALDEAPLAAIRAHYQILDIREHFFFVMGIPHLVCVLGCQPLAKGSQTTPEPSAISGVSAPPPRPRAARAPRQPDASVDLSTHESGATPPADPPQNARGLSPLERQLFDALRVWRKDRAHEDGVPRYVVFTNRDLEALVRRRPRTLAELRAIRGIGKAKVERYGEQVLKLLHPASPDGPDHNDDIPSAPESDHTAQSPPSDDEGVYDQAPAR